jgi:hypothetical protein
LSKSLKKLLKDQGLSHLAASFEFEEKLKALAMGDSLAKRLASLDSTKNLALSMPKYEPIQIPKMPTFEDSNNFQSSGVLLKRLADSIVQWRSELGDDMQPAIIAILHGGIQIDVEQLAQESFHGIRILGRLNGSTCVILAHQATVQLLCYAQPIQPPERPNRPIGFVINGEKSEV